jgi:hypothetical protein
MPTVSQKHTGDVLRKWRLVLSHADILTLQSVPVAFVPAPSNANNAYRVLGASVQAQLNSGAPYTGNAATVVLNFNAGNSTGPLLCNTVNLNAVIARTPRTGSQPGNRRQSRQTSPCLLDRASPLP